MKTKFIILLIILIQISCKEEKSELERSWILVEQRRKPNSSWMQQLRGLLVCFEGDKMKYSFITSKEETKKSFLIENQFIKIDTSTFGRIIHLSKDSLIIEADTNSYDMHFRPLENITFNSNEKQIIQNRLTNTSWRMEDGKTFQRFYCDTAIWRGMPEEKNDVKSIVYEQKTKDWKEISNYEWWTLKHFDGKLIFGYSYGQTENSFFQITKSNDNSLEGNYSNPYEKNWIQRKFTKSKQLSEETLKEMKEMIIGQWELIKMIEPNILNINSIEENADFSGSGLLRYDGRISKTDLKKHNISFTFKENGKFLISANNREIRKGNLWRLTNDGCFIKLGAGIGGNDFIKIFSLFDDSMHIQKKEIIDSEKRELDFFETFLNLKMLKKEN